VNRVFQSKPPCAAAASTPVGKSRIDGGEEARGPTSRGRPSRAPPSTRAAPPSRARLARAGGFARRAPAPAAQERQSGCTVRRPANTAPRRRQRSGLDCHPRQRLSGVTAVCESHCQGDQGKPGGQSQRPQAGSSFEGRAQHAPECKADHHQKVCIARARAWASLARSRPTNTSPRSSMK